MVNDYSQLIICPIKNFQKNIGLPEESGYKTVMVVYKAFWLLCILVLLFGGGRLSAEEKQKRSSLVMIYSMKNCCPDNYWPEVEDLSQKEIAALSWPVEIKTARSQWEQEQKDEMAQLARKHKAWAVVRIERTNNHTARAAFWVYPQAEMPPDWLEITQELSLDKDLQIDSRIAALKVVEAIRSRLIEATPQDVRQPSPPRPIVLAALKTTRLDLGVQSGLVLTNGEAGLHGSLGLNLAIELNPRFKLGAAIMLSYAGQNIVDPQAQSSLNLAWLEINLLYRVLGWENFNLALGPASGLFLVLTKGTAMSPLIAQDDYLLACWLAGMVQTSYDLSDSWFLELNSRLGVLLPKVYINLADQTHQFGLPLFSLDLAIGYTF
jgi:hypothetical protein